jgi:5'(3')-deoxyribonucleotidase
VVCAVHKNVRAKVDNIARKEVKTMTRIFFDMDGVLAEYKEVEYEELLKKGYFRDLRPQDEVIKAMKALSENPEFEVHTLSAIIPENEYARDEKDDWLRDNIPFLDRIKINYLFCGENKSDKVPGGIREDDILIDDYNANLNDWAKKGVAVKFLNGINHKHKSWQGLTAANDCSAILATVYRAVKTA